MDQSQCVVAATRPVATGHRSCIFHFKSKLTSAHDKCMQDMEQVLENFSSRYICVRPRGGGRERPVPWQNVSCKLSGCTCCNRVGVGTHDRSKQRTPRTTCSDGW